MKISPLFICQFQNIGQVDDPVFDADGPNELHAPDGVGLPVLDESPQRVGFERPLKTALVETESRFDGAVFGQLVGFEFTNNNLTKRRSGPEIRRFDN
jgi:hypothetical protein